jgi:ankyrin repeat protein
MVATSSPCALCPLPLPVWHWQLQLLMRENADVNLQNRDGKTALMMAVAAQRVPNVELLLQVGGAVVGITDYSLAGPGGLPVTASGPGRPAAGGSGSEGILGATGAAGGRGGPGGQAGGGSHGGHGATSAASLGGALRSPLANGAPHHDSSGPTLGPPVGRSALDYAAATGDKALWRLVFSYASSRSAGLQGVRVQQRKVEYARLREARAKEFVARTLEQCVAVRRKLASAEYETCECLPVGCATSVGFYY